MDYIVEYEIAALCIQLLLVVIYLMRNSIKNSTSRVFFAMCICNIVAVVFNIISIFTLKHIEDFPKAINYFVNIVYLLSFSLSAVVFAIYVISVTGEKKLRRVIMIFCSVTVLISALLLITTPFTGLIFNFENEQYNHGPLFVILYINSFALLMFVLVLFIKNIKRLNKLQTAAIGVFILATIASVSIQAFIQELLIQDMVIALLNILVYISLQNPEDYLDKVSECYNQTAFYMITEKNINKKNPFTLVAFALDDFQYINRMLGINAGNDLLNDISIYLIGAFGKRNVFHLMGAKYAVLLEGKAQASVDDVVSQIKDHFARPYCVDNVEVLVSPFICTLKYPEFNLKPEDINDALEASFRSLANNRELGVLEVNEDSLSQKRREGRINNIMKRAIMYNGFEVYYQPIYDTEQGKFNSAEALIRLYDSDLGFISPDEFIPMAEKNGMIIEIGEIVFRKVCEFLRDGEATKYGLKYIEVNLSTIQCMQENLAQRLHDIMAEYGISPDRINFEITETAHSANENALRKNMDMLILQGSSFSMDDYGTGFSTANYLISLPMKIVKIDKSILWPAMVDEEAFIVLRHTVSMLKALNKKIVVEGVENENMVTLLKEMGCDYLQGFFYSKPVPESQFVNFLKAKQESVTD